MDVLVAIGIILILVAIIGFEVIFIKSIKTSSECEVRIEEKPKKAELSEEDKEKQEKLRKSFEELMSYDYEKALKKE